MPPLVELTYALSGTTSSSAKSWIVVEAELTTTPETVLGA